MKLFGLGVISVPTAQTTLGGKENLEAEAILTKMANATMVAQYLDDGEVAAVFTNTSKRVLETV